ncbi:MAG: enoyl-CoA hydratase/isomerase family protein [Ramlibacter sp.]|nr:enoyl-CoA hydratase/isomerase family protein [Ramlibacter sp.]
MLVSRHPQAGILELRLNRPRRLNALTQGLARQLLDAVRQGNADDSVRVLLLTGEGRAFCAGKDRDDAASAPFVEVLQQLASALMQSPKPVVAAVQGWAVGAGLELLLNCDIVVAAQDARFMLPEVNAGLFGTGGVLALLPRQIGLARAKGALMLGQEFGARQAEQWGLIWSVVEEGELAPAALAIAARLAAADPAILGRIKSLLHRESLGELREVLEREAQAHRDLPRG